MSTDQPTDERDPGLYITVRLDHVTERQSPTYPYKVKTSVETLAEATDQRFSPSVMASLLRALADEVQPAKTNLPF